MMAHASVLLSPVMTGCLLLVACAAQRAPAADAPATPTPAEGAPSASVEPAPLAASAAEAPARAEEVATAKAPTAAEPEATAEPAPRTAESPSVPVVSRADAREAIRMANEGDRSVKVNVEGAIQKYERARELDPGNARIAYKLAQAYEKKQDWARMASTLATAATLDPEEARYPFKRGYALVKLAEAGDPDQYEAAKVPLTRCIQLDPERAECHFFLGMAAEYTVDDQAALESYTRAIESDPTIAYFYPPLAALYIVHKRYREAAQTLAEATRHIAPTEANVESLYAIHILRFRLGQAEGDNLAMLETMEQAQQIAGDAHPEIAFNLGATYAAQDPPQKEKAVWYLTSFTKRVCRSARAARYREQCAFAIELLQQLGGR